MVNDPISDFLIRLKNASMARRDTVSLPFSKMKLAIAEILEREGYVAEVDAQPKKYTLSVKLSYKNGAPIITDLKRVSKPSRRLYMGAHEIRPVKRGHGLLVLSTPAGLLSGKEAKMKHVGGEPLFEIW